MGLPVLGTLSLSPGSLYLRTPYCDLARCQGLGGVSFGGYHANQYCNIPINKLLKAYS